MLDTGQQSLTTNQLQERKRLHHWLSEYLQWTGHPKAHDVFQCHKVWQLYTCPDDHETFRATRSCRFPLCPWCQGQRAARLREAFTTAAQDADIAQLRYITLTIPNTVSLNFDDVRTPLNKLMRSKWWKARVQGGCYALETTWSPLFDWHPHVNIIIQKHPYADLDVDELRTLWASLAPGARQIKILPVTTNSWAELAKYVVKGSDLIGYPEQVDAYLKQTARKRLAATFGTWWGRPLTIDDAAETATPRLVSCATCHQPTLRRAVWLDLKDLLLINGQFQRRSAETIPIALPLPQQYEFSLSA